jgi:RNAse (barnase) inhibitor barstar
MKNLRTTKGKTSLPDYFRDNLDGLYDVLTGDLEMPLHIEFVNLSVDQLETFEDLLRQWKMQKKMLKALLSPIFWNNLKMKIKLM